MKHVHINTVPNGSTGRIMLSQHRTLLETGSVSYAFWGRGRLAENKAECRFANDVEVYLDVLQTRIDGRAGFHSKKATHRLLKRLNDIQPDLVHLHNLHGYYLNIELLFNWLDQHGCMVEWTLHDCWAFTGHCAYFTYANCVQWQTHCARIEPCAQLNRYPKTMNKKTCSWNFEQKRRLFTSIPANRMTLITPSYWLAHLVKKSFFSEYNVIVRRNSIDTTMFRPTPSNFRERYGICNRFMILGVANRWDDRKGLEDFIKLREMLDDQKFAIILVGLSARQSKNLPEGIISIKRTDSQRELAEIYSSADVFFNPTYEENYPTVNLESEACGTPVIAYDSGGTSETLCREDSAVVPAGDIASANNLIQNMAKDILKQAL